jgi:hypothetical protein
MAAASRGLTVFRRDVVVAWVNAFHPLVATLLMVTRYITTTWSSFFCLMFMRLRRVGFSFLLYLLFFL